MTATALLHPNTHTELGVPGFPALERVRRKSGELRTRVKGGLDIWQYVFVAQAHDFDVEKVAEHLRRNAEEVRIAIDYYRVNPAEADAHIEEIERLWEKAVVDPVTDRVTLR